MNHPQLSERAQRAHLLRDKIDRILAAGEGEFLPIWEPSAWKKVRSQPTTPAEPGEGVPLPPVEQGGEAPLPVEIIEEPAAEETPVVNPSISYAQPPSEAGAPGGSAGEPVVPAQAPAPASTGTPSTGSTAAASGTPFRLFHRREHPAVLAGTGKGAGSGGRGGRHAAEAAPGKKKRKGFFSSVFVRVLVVLLFVAVVLAIGLASFLVYRYYSIASALPDLSNLPAHASQFETTRIYDRNGGLLYEINDPATGKRTYVPLSKISPNVVAATLATEDKDFYTHPGFDALAILRALFQNYTSGEIVSGASTITQQLARNLLMTPEERSQQTVERKTTEIVMAAEITRRYSKDEIMELYLNEVYYGNLSYGIEAAAETYFNTTADKLDLAQAAFLAGLPQAPALYDVYTSRQPTLDRQQQVLLLMYQLSNERNCIRVNKAQTPVCVSAEQAAQAVKEVENLPFTAPQNVVRYPHWVNYIRFLLEQRYDPQTVYQSGFNVYTTLDPALQDQADQIVKEQVDSLAGHDATDGALVAIRPSTGEILAMVGSADFYNNAIAGQINMALAPRQPGSSIKPLTYVAAFEKGWTPATLIWDVPTDFPPSGDPNDTRPPYKPVNYDGVFRGPLTVRWALANSINIPAVKTLQFVGIYGQGGLIDMAKRLGITTLTRDDYGLSLTLGGGEVSLLEMTSAYGVFANGGVRVAPFAISRITDHNGNVVYEQQSQAQQVLRPEHAYLISSILSDNVARSPEFSANSPLNLPFPAAAKTGTTNDFRDNWTMGYTPDLAVGVWVGNADDSPMKDVTGITGAAPIWGKFMRAAVPLVTGGQTHDFTRPAGIVDKVICSVSGTEPSDACPSQRVEVFASDQPPLPKEDDLWQNVQIDTWTNALATSACAEFTKQELALNVTDPTAVAWIQNTQAGKDWAHKMGFQDPIFFKPTQTCQPGDPYPTLVFVGLQDGQTVTQSPLPVYLVANASDGFTSYRVEYGEGDDPQQWQTLVPDRSDPIAQPQKVADWDLSSLPPGEVTLRVTMQSTHNTSAEKRIHLNLAVPTPTPEPTATPTALPTPTSAGFPWPFGVFFPTSTPAR
jgi:1A family penicillin-binding protein